MENHVYYIYICRHIWEDPIKHHLFLVNIKLLNMNQNSWWTFFTMSLWFHHWTFTGQVGACTYTSGLGPPAKTGDWIKPALVISWDWIEISPAKRQTKRVDLRIYIHFPVDFLHCKVQISQFTRCGLVEHLGISSTWWGNLALDLGIFLDPAP